MGQAVPSPAEAIQIDLGTGNTPLPVDAAGVAMWVGVKYRVLWWVVLNRSKMYREIRIPKPGTKEKRILHDPEPMLKHMQKMFLYRVLNKFDGGAHVGAYEKDRGVKYTAARHAGHGVVVELDIKDFFGSTKRQYVREFFRRKGWPDESAKVAADLLTFPIKPTKSIVPQGAPSSPKLCNLVAAMRFDPAILAFIHRIDPGWVYTRYSDNLILSHPQGRSSEEVNSIIQHVKHVVRLSGYRVHPRKVKVMRRTNPRRPQRLLGLVVNEKPNLSQESYRRLRAQVDRACRSGFDLVTGLPKTGMTAPQKAAHLNGLISYYRYICPSEKLLRLKCKLDKAIEQHLPDDIIEILADAAVEETGGTPATLP